MELFKVDSNMFCFIFYKNISSCCVANIEARRNLEGYGNSYMQCGNLGCEVVEMMRTGQMIIFVRGQEKRMSV